MNNSQERLTRTLAMVLQGELVVQEVERREGAVGCGGQHWLAERFQDNRRHLRAVAYRMLGSVSEADDAVQEFWLRLSRSDVSSVGNLQAWFTTGVARVRLDMLRS